MRNAFGFVEVLVAIVILSTVGMALLKFNAFNKHIMQKNIQLFENNLVNSPLLYLKQTDSYTAKTQITLFDVISFRNLSDDDMRFLKNTTFQIFSQYGEETFLFNDGVKSRYIQAYTISIEHKNSVAQYLLLEEGK